jgi:hypothetical protein
MSERERDEVTMIKDMCPMMRRIFDIAAIVLHGRSSLVKADGRFPSEESNVEATRSSSSELDVLGKGSGYCCR